MSDCKQASKPGDEKWCEARRGMIGIFPVNVGDVEEDNHVLEAFPDMKT